MPQKTLKNKLNTNGIWLLSFLYSVNLMGQQLPDFTQFRALQTIINPGAIPLDYFTTGGETNLFLGATWRDQWKNSNLKNPPSTKILRADYFLNASPDPSLLIGGYVLNDQNGIFFRTGFYGKIAGVLDFPKGKLSAGISGGFVQSQLKFRSSTNGRPVGVGIQDNFSGVFPDVGLGVFYQHDLSKENNLLYMGISIPQIFNFSNNYEDLPEKETRIRHYYSTFGLIKYFTDQSFIEPAVWVKYVPNTPLAINLNFRAQIKNQLWFGLGSDFTTRGALINLDFGILQEWGNANLKIGFGFSYPLSSYNNLIGGTQEYNLSSAFSTY